MRPGEHLDRLGPAAVPGHRLQRVPFQSHHVGQGVRVGGVALTTRAAFGLAEPGHLDAGGDPTLVAGWIGETVAIRKAAQARLGLTEAPPERMSEEQLAAIVDAFGGLLGLLRRADQHDRAEIYTRIGLQMTYRPDTETVLAEVRSKDIDRVPVMCPEGDLNPHAR